MALDPAVAAVRLGVRAALADLEAGATVLVACSGGADSLALAAATVFEARARELRVVGVTVDHGLQEGSHQQAERVVAQLELLGADETATARVHVEAADLGPEAAAREARYAVLGQMAESFSAAAVLLGHTRDDQAETVLLGLARGSGGRSIAGMRRAYDLYRRPLLDVTRAQTRAACEAEGLQPWDDPHNSDPGYARVRVRERVLPVLETELGPGVGAALARTADLLREDMEFLDALTDEAWTGSLEVAVLAASPRPIRTRLIRRAALEAGVPSDRLTATHIAEIEALVTQWRGQVGVDVPGSIRVVRREGAIEFVSCA
ncbi:tRNA(Ile)-lysidine synthase [Nocardioides baekrokdamisoli]|uniref:tRNA(Ile)-lysidine synthase n=1 Tax=Nocardioides baekrokdamisoli TaxID=1804624 RepID=A0A3G9J2G9_9ACTN|nr:tRNA lysidine(34) synthetase TilS [Nocardioides baekrokdamisoli]BBH17778.1 tRNA(Ile)-lysidine synthase [Nocardioides baekrokdamisoli]